jgi:hypothetical protein
VARGTKPKATARDKFDSRLISILQFKWLIPTSLAAEATRGFPELARHSLTVPSPGFPPTTGLVLSSGGIFSNGLEELFQKFPRFGFAVAGHLQADSLPQEWIEALDKRNDLTRNEKRNSGVLD